MLRHRRVEPDNYVLEDITRDVVTTDIRIKAQIQAIQSCDTSLEDLEPLNEAVRADLASQRRLVERLEAAASQPGREHERAQLQQQADTYGQQLTGQLLQLRRANVTAQLNIEKRNTTELFGRRPDSAQARQRLGREQLSKMSSQVTDNLMSINRKLAEQVERSKGTLDVLVNSSDKVGETHDELKNVGGAIGQSRKLLNKYGRRELTDTTLFILAFAFFFACVLYVVKKRLWGW
ncbi:vesicle transport protein SEC20-like [Pollicipes pollicipes]|uniref:vesicle transport protein SEC20-like n=1 Tax=Pollicipes pollicipes TaxID=41117 RepID=UPI0018853A34|nr:vesicle transport protein SEC20-like [Pollicipes pollicipes]XP_037088534.1 vesicle transport protein SEC20-like [Pollicipes pollicipes]